MKKIRSKHIITVISLLLTTSLFGQVINEYVAKHSSNGTGSQENREYIEVYGTPNTDLSSFYILQVNGDNLLEGSITSFYQLGTTDADGYYWTGFLDTQLDDDSMTLLLVLNFSGSLGQDLDTNNDGTFDSTPWTAIIDSIAIVETGDIGYSPAVLTPNYDGITFLPAGASRIPNGVDTDTVSDWKRNDWDGEGLVGFTGTLTPTECINTPNAENAAAYPPAEPVINEFVADHTGADSFEYVEIYGDANVDYSNTSVLVLEGDQGEDPGVIDGVYSVGTTNANGLWATSYQVDQIEDGSLTLLLVSDFSGSAGDDLDTNDDGTLDSAPWTSLLDAVSMRDADEGDSGYASFTIISPLNSSGASGGASRIPNALDTDQASDWMFNDYEGDGLPGFNTQAGNNEAVNTYMANNRSSLGGYYATVNASSSVTLRLTLHEVIDDHTRYPYSSSSIDTWDILELADEDPTDASSIISVYRNESYLKFGGGIGVYNREHSWPKSYGFSADGNCVYPYTDCHHLMLSNVGYNSNRGNRYFDNCSSGCTSDVAIYNAANNVGGTPADVNQMGGTSSETYEVWPERRGDIARAQFYMDIRYEGGTHNITGCSEPDLILVDNAALINTGSTYMGLLSVLIQWHYEDPVDDVERLRNEVVYSFQGNRNPFVDHPEWVDCLYNGTCDVAVLPCVQAHYAEWAIGPGGVCPGEDRVSIRSFLSMLNLDCECSP